MQGPGIGPARGVALLPPGLHEPRHRPRHRSALAALQVTFSFNLPLIHLSWISLSSHPWTSLGSLFHPTDGHGPLNLPPIDLSISAGTQRCWARRCPPSPGSLPTTLLSPTSLTKSTWKRSSLLPLRRTVSTPSIQNLKYY